MPFTNPSITNAFVAFEVFEINETRKDSGFVGRR
jgi:hypothetical protein